MKQKKIFLFLISIILFFFFSCELFFQEQEQGCLNIISIGNNFKDCPKHCTINDSVFILNELNSCENDANAVCSVFENLAEKAKMKKNVYNLSGKGINDFIIAITELQLNAKENDLTFIYISTHGNNEIKEKISYNNSNEKNACFILETSNTENPQAVFLDEFQEWIEKIPGTVFVVADFCYSGALISQNNITCNSKIYKNTNVFDILFNHEKGFESFNKFFLCASTYFESSYAFDELSAFTDVFLESLGMQSYNIIEKKALMSSSIPSESNSKICLSSIYSYINEVLPKKFNGFVQNAQQSACTTEFVLFRF